MEDARLPQVLVVEDDPAIGATLEAALSTVGCEVVRAGSLAAALVLAAQRPRLITLDVNLPDATAACFWTIWPATPHCSGSRWW